jgi:hypothetical protein
VGEGRKGVFVLRRKEMKMKMKMNDVSIHNFRA